MRALRLRFVGAVWPALIACGQTSYDLYDPVGAEVAAGGTVQVPGSGGEVTVPEAGGTGGTELMGGAGPVDEPNPCFSGRDPDLVLTRIALESTNLCVARGDATTFFDSPGFEVTVAPCIEDETQWWAVQGLSGGSWELRNEATNLNLDMNYAAQSDGTPAVLFDPHRNFNQRFYILPGENESIYFAPAHVQGKCLEVRGNALEMWPCDSQNPNQIFRQLSCVDEQ